MLPALPHVLMTHLMPGARCLNHRLQRAYKACNVISATRDARTSHHGIATAEAGCSSHKQSHSTAARRHCSAAQKRQPHQCVSVQHVAGKTCTAVAHALPDSTAAVQERHSDTAALAEELLHVDLRSGAHTVAVHKWLPGGHASDAMHPRGQFKPVAPHSAQNKRTLWHVTLAAPTPLLRFVLHREDRGMDLGLDLVPGVPLMLQPLRVLGTEFNLVVPDVDAVMDAYISAGDCRV